MRLRALAALSCAERRRPAARANAARWSGGSWPSGSASRSIRMAIAVRAASASSARAIGRNQRAFAAILARNRHCSGVTRRSCFQQGGRSTPLRPPAHGASLSGIKAAPDAEGLISRDWREAGTERTPERLSCGSRAAPRYAAAADCGRVAARQGAHVLGSMVL